MSCCMVAGWAERIAWSMAIRVLVAVKPFCLSTFFISACITYLFILVVAQNWLVVSRITFGMTLSVCKNNTKLRQFCNIMLIYIQ